MVVSSALPVLDVPSPDEIQLEKLRINLPCQANWNEMAGDNRARFCELCQKKVHNLAAMRRPEIVALLKAGPEKVCGRITRDAGGRLVTLETLSAAALHRPRRNQFSLLALMVMLTVLSPVMAVSPSVYNWAKRKMDEWFPQNETTAIATGVAMPYADPPSGGMTLDEIPLMGDVAE